MNKNIFLIIIIFFLSILAITVVVFLFNGRDSQNYTANAPIEFIDGKKYDWGDIDINGGKVGKTFEIKNTGTENLEITNFKTSCMCTDVQIFIGEEKSPIFGMHGGPSWKGNIEPSKTAQIKIVFDPLSHGPQSTGKLSRLVSFETNSIDNKRVELELTANVVSGSL